MPDQILYCYVVTAKMAMPQLLTRTSFVEPRYDVPNGITDAGESIEQAAQRIIREQVGIHVELSAVKVLDGVPSSDVQYCRIDIDAGYPDRFSHTNPEALDIAELHYRWLPVDASLPLMLVDRAAGKLDNLMQTVDNSAVTSQSPSRISLMERVYGRFVRIWGNWPIPAWLRTMVIWAVEPKYLAGVVGVIFDEQDRVLLVKHTYRKDFPWAPPSGWMKRNEDPTEALEREIFEETGYRVWVGGAIAVGGDKTIHRLDLYYRCTLLGGAFRPCAEVSDAKLYALDELPDVLEPFHREVIAYAAKRKGSGIPPRAA